MMSPVGTLDAETPPMIAKVGLAQTGDFMHRFRVSAVWMAEKAVKSSLPREF
jgi:hypothetical protein